MQPSTEKVLAKNKRGRPATGRGQTIGVRLHPDLLAWVDTERAKLTPEPSRPEFIRSLIERSKDQ